MASRLHSTLATLLLASAFASAQTDGPGNIAVHLTDGKAWAFPLEQLDSITALPQDNTPSQWLYTNQVKTVTTMRTFNVSASISSWYYNLENPQVMKYLNTVRYDNSDYLASQVVSYNTPYTSYKKHQPLGVNINCTAPIDSVRLSLRPDFQTRIDPSAVTIYDKGFTAINLTPRCQYFYRAYLADGTTTEGHFYTLGNIRMIRADKVINIRDIGGWTTSDGRRIRYGLIYRGAEMDGTHDTRLSAADSIFFRNHLRIRFDCDLRKAEEADSSGRSPLGSDILYKRYDVVQYGLDHPDYYQAFRDILAQLRLSQATYIHCWMGADRTGTLCYLLEALLGVPEEELCKDYELTTFCGQQRTRDANNFQLLYNRILAFKGQNMKERAENIFLAYGITRAEIEEFRQLMLE